MNKYIHYTLVKQIDVIDLEVKLDNFVFGFNPEGHEYNGTIYDLSKKGSFSRAGENDYLEINVAINTLQILKNYGATHVDITPHDEHYGYHFHGGIFRIATEEDIEKHLKSTRDAKMLVLKTEIERAKKILETYPIKLENLNNECSKSQS